MNKKRINILLSVICACVVLSLLLVKINEVSSLKNLLEVTKLEHSLEIEESYVERDALTQEINRLLEIQSELETAIESYKKTQEQPEQAIEPERIIIDGASIEELKRVGIADYTQISKDLLSKPEFIPYDGVLGGTMFFIEVLLLNNKWALGTFEDGHILGYGLYEYTINENRDITWEIIDSYIVGSE